jgi:hypothetical protein
MSFHVFFNFPSDAVAATLAFLGFGLVEGLAALSAVVLFATGRRRAAAGALAGAVGLAALSGWVLLVLSLASD